SPSTSSAVRARAGALDVLALDRLAVGADDVPLGTELLELLTLRPARLARVGGVVVERVAVIGHLRLAVVALDRAECGGIEPAGPLRLGARLERRPHGRACSGAVALALLVLLEEIERVSLSVDDEVPAHPQRRRTAVRARHRTAAACGHECKTERHHHDSVQRSHRDPSSRQPYGLQSIRRRSAGGLPTATN